MNNSTNRVSIPSGTYWIIDPCYVLGDYLYDIITDDIFKNEDINDSYPYEYAANGDKMVILPTKWGDGEYKTNVDGPYICVDSGQIGIISEAFISSEKYTDEELKDFGIRITVPEGEVYSEEDGTLHFSNVMVYTGENEEDDEEYF